MLCFGTKIQIKLCPKTYLDEFLSFFFWNESLQVKQAYLGPLPKVTYEQKIIEYP